MSQPSEPTASASAPPAEAGGAAARIRDLLGLLGKSVRAYQMYQANNPVYQRFLDGLRAAFAEIWEILPALRFEVAEAGFVREGETYAVGEGRESLAFQFYKDGVRYVTFLPGFEEELERFLDVVVRARHLGAEEDDLVTLLWERDFEAFQYGYVDLLAEGLEIPETGEPRLEPVSADALRTEAAATEDAEEGADAAAAPGAAALSREDFNETLYFLEPDEFERLRQELDHEWARDLRTDVLNALFDRLEEPRPERQAEILGILRQLLPSFLARGDLRSAAKVLQELEAILAREDVLDPELRRRADGLFDELSEPDVIAQLIRSLEDGDIDPRSEELSLFLARLRPAAIPALFRMVESSTPGAARERVQEAGDRLAAEHPEVVVELLSSEEEAVATSAARTAGRLRLASATEGLIRLLSRPEARARLAAVEALVALRSSQALEGLDRALGDENREIRIAAARGLGALRFAPARARLEACITGRALRDADLTEKLAFFEAYADLGGVEAVAVLDRILNGRGLLGRRQPAELRACAATALGRIGAPVARASLERAADDSDTIVRGAVVRALRKEVPAS